MGPGGGGANPPASRDFLQGLEGLQVFGGFYLGNETPGQSLGIMLPDKIRDTAGDILRLIKYLLFI